MIVDLEKVHRFQEVVTYMTVVMAGWKVGPGLFKDQDWSNKLCPEQQSLELGFQREMRT